MLGRFSIPKPNNSVSFLMVMATRTSTRCFATRTPYNLLHEWNKYILFKQLLSFRRSVAFVIFETLPGSICIQQCSIQLHLIVWQVAYISYHRVDYVPSQSHTFDFCPRPYIIEPLTSSYHPVTHDVISSSHLQVATHLQYHGTTWYRELTLAIFGLVACIVGPGHLFFGINPLLKPFGCPRARFRVQPRLTGVTPRHAFWQPKWPQT